MLETTWYTQMRVKSNRHKRETQNQKDTGRERGPREREKLEWLSNYKIICKVHTWTTKN